MIDAFAASLMRPQTAPTWITFLKILKTCLPVELEL